MPTSAPSPDRPEPAPSKGVPVVPPTTKNEEPEFVDEADLPPERANREEADGGSGKGGKPR